MSSLSRGPSIHVLRAHWAPASVCGIIGAVVVAPTRVLHANQTTA